MCFGIYHVWRCDLWEAVTLGAPFPLWFYHILHRIYRGYYTAARRYEFYFRVVETVFYERENKIHIFKPPCNFLFIICTRVFLHKQQCMSGKWRQQYPHSLRHSSPGCSFVWTLRVVYFPLKHSCLYNKTSHHVRSQYFTSHHSTTHHITSHLSTAQHSTAHHITSHHITSHHIISYHIISYIISYHIIHINHII